MVEDILLNVTGRAVGNLFDLAACVKLATLQVSGSLLNLSALCQIC